MYQLKSLNDTIVAISTAMGQGGIGIVRLSGAEAIEICDKMFVAAKRLSGNVIFEKSGEKSILRQSPNKKTLAESESHTVHYGWIMLEEAPDAPASYKNKERRNNVDEVLITIMRGPRSYTREDVIEINCHGGVAALRSILALACDMGARLAEPGEFTKRAFLNGRIDLTQAEAVLDIIQSKTESFLQVSTHQLKGDLSRELERIRAQLMDVYGAMEAIINFPEDDLDVDKERRGFPLLQEASGCVKKLLDSSEHGKILKDGIKVVLCGKPNVGKSSLLNILLKTPRAIVSDIAGTTRDTIEETAQIKGIPLQLIDTAGVLAPRDILEAAAVKRSHLSMQNADLVLLVLDANAELSEEDEIIIQKVKGQNILVILNKSDLPRKINAQRVKSFLGHAQMCEVSALKKIGIEVLESMIVENVWHSKTIDTHAVLVSNLRHINSLKNCQSSLEKSQEDLRHGLSLEFISEGIKGAVNFLDSITGRNIDSDLLENIFSQFCIGK